MPRWTAQSGNPPQPIGKQLTDQERGARLDKVNQALEAQDNSDLVEILQRHRNVVYIIDNRVTYPDL